MFLKCIPAAMMAAFLCRYKYCRTHIIKAVPIRRSRRNL